MRTSQNTKKNKKVFTKYMQEKLAITVIVITLALFALAAVLYNIIKNKQVDYSQTVLSQQNYDSRVIPYRRGDIVDRNGTYLATSERVYNLIIDPDQITYSEEDFLEPTVEALSVCFGYNKEEMRDLILEKEDMFYIRYARQLTYEQKEAFDEYKTNTNKAFSDAKSKQRVKGIWFENEYKRVYPYSSLACNVIGFAGRDGDKGTGGIEQFYNSTLIGTNGREYGYLNDDSNLERVIKGAENGNTIVSTIDVNIQKVVEKYINEWQTNTGSKTTAAIVMDPNNGEVLAMASNRQFDLNNPRDLTPFYTEAEIEAMDEDAQMLAWNTIWRNYCVSDTFEPGSPIKPFTIAAALEEGLLNGYESFDCDGGQRVGGWTIKCVNRYGHGPLTVQEALMVSCNDVMMQVANIIGRDRFSKYQKLFGFGSKTEIDLPGEADTSSLIFNAEDMGVSDLATNSFGQNFNVTMIQMAAAWCSLINGGEYYEPHVVKQVLNDQNALVKRMEPKLVRETVSGSTADYMNEAMYQTVYGAKGTGKAAQIQGYTVGGKTGTAQKYPRSKETYLVSFAGFAPTDDPQVMVYVIIDEPNYPPGPEQAHSSYATEIVQKILKDILPYMNVFPEGEAAAPELPETDPETKPDSNPETGGQETDGSKPDPADQSDAAQESAAGEISESESAQFATDEYIDSEGGLGLPENELLEESLAETEPEASIVFPGSHTQADNANPAPGNSPTEASPQDQSGEAPVVSPGVQPGA